MSKEPHKFGKWPSGISAEFVAGKALRFQNVQALGDILYWSERHPEQNGRVTIMHARLDGQEHELFEAPWSVSTKVHEYGGSAFLATDKTLFFVNAEDQQIWTLDNQLGGENTQSLPSMPKPNIPKHLTHSPAWRFADFTHDEQRQQLICIGEKHNERDPHPLNMIVSIPLAGDQAGEIIPLVKGDDFYASPRLSPDGNTLAYLSWNLPKMPWEHAQLYLASLDPAGQVTSTAQPANTLDGASFQPEWALDGTLWFINDDTGFGQLYRHNQGKTELFALELAECGAPLWNLGMKTYGFLSDGRLAVIALLQGKAVLSLIDPDTSTGVHKAIEQNEICAIDQLVIWNDSIAGIVSQYSKPQAIASINTKNGALHIFKSSTSFDLPTSELSIAQTLTFKNERGETVYGHYYPPTNSHYSAPLHELPPVILTAHGGPTAYSDCGLTLKVQFWTSRGFGYFDINYSGSWGFGKAYRQRLDGQWGLADVADMAAGARFLASTGLGDPERLLISGSSAGGYSVLMALVRSDLFAAGASYYGISDLARLNDSTHKFEAGYTASLLGLTKDNQRKRLEQRSPLCQADQITAPMIFFQGLQDKVVPPEQAELMVQALKKRGLKTVYKSFDKEGHGFRSSQTIKTALEMEYQFYLDVLGI